MAQITEKQTIVLAWMQANEGEHFASEIAEGCGLTEASVRPILTGLTKPTKERADVYVAKSDDKKEKEVLDKDGNPVTRSYNVYFLTEAGAALAL